MKTITLSEENIHSGNLILVNAQYPCKETKANAFIPADEHFSAILMNREAADRLQLIFKKIAAENSIIPISGYRSLEEQHALYQQSLRDNGEDFTRKFVAMPNDSEHQTGLAIDLALNKENVDFICPEFPYRGICEDFRSLAPDYGFIERYAKSKEAITGIAHEPWHFRYVGFPHSKIITENNFSLEEYTNFLKNYQEANKYIYPQVGKGQIEVWYVPANAHETTLLLPEKMVSQISGNNVDGFVITLWRNAHE